MNPFQIYQGTQTYLWKMFFVVVSFRGIFTDSSSFQKQTKKTTHTHTHTHTWKPCVNYITCWAFSIYIYRVSGLCIKGDNRPALCHTHIQWNKSVTDPYKSTNNTCDVCTGFSSCGSRETIYQQCAPYRQCNRTVTEPQKSTTGNTINPSLQQLASVMLLENYQQSGKSETLSFVPFSFLLNQHLKGFPSKRRVFESWSIIGLESTLFIGVCVCFSGHTFYRLEQWRGSY